MKSSLRLAVSAALVVIAAGSMPSLRAAFFLYQNFEGLPVGYDIAGDDPNENFIVGNQDIGAGTRYGGYTVIEDPTNIGNKLLELNAVGMAFTGSLGSLSVVNNTQATIFYRIHRLGVGSTLDVNFGIADTDTPPTGQNNGTSYESQLNFSGNSALTLGEFRPRNGGDLIDTAAYWDPGLWFGVYQVIDSVTNTTVFYYQSEGDETPIRLQGYMTGRFNMNFRNGITNENDLINFLVLNGLPVGGGTQDIYYLDDIYVDLDGENLISPVPIASVPEPSTLLLLLGGIGGWGVWSRLRRKNRP